MSDPSLKLAVSIPEAASALSIAPRTVRAWIASGKLQAVRLGRRVVIRVSELERLLSNAEEAAKADKTDREQVAEAV